MSSILSVHQINKTIGSQSILNNVSFELQPNSITSIVGESGCGKTTLLRIIAGHDHCDSGKIEIQQQDKTSAPPQKRNIGLVFQDYALFPHLTIAKNISYGLKKNNPNRVEQLLKLISLPDIAKRFPHELSGGQQQRVAIARALAPSPSLLLMDEPFSNLDAIKRKAIRSSIQSITKESDTTTLIVTHDIKDALAISDSVIVIKAGSILEESTPDELINSEDPYVKSMLE